MDATPKLQEIPETNLHEPCEEGEYANTDHMLTYPLARSAHEKSNSCIDKILDRLFGDDAGDVSKETGSKGDLIDLTPRPDAKLPTLRESPVTITQSFQDGELVTSP